MKPIDIRADLVRYDIPLYVVAADVGVNPSRLGAMLRGRLPLRPELADRVRQAIERRRSARFPRERDRQ